MKTHYYFVKLRKKKTSSFVSANFAYSVLLLIYKILLHNVTVRLELKRNVFNKRYNSKSENKILIKNRDCLVTKECKRDNWSRC